MADEVLALEGVSKAYGSRAALSDVSIRVRSGEAVGYLGPNGAGKTTTLKLLVGWIAPDRGTVRLLGKDPRRDPVGALTGVGALLESPGSVPYLHGRDWLAYAAEVKGIARSHRADAVDEAAVATGVRAELDRPLGTLSTGLLRRTMIAAALVGRPPVLLLDEPTLGLDPAARADLRALLRRLHAGGQTLLLSSHLLDDVEEVCDRVLFLRDGRLQGDERVDRDDPSDGPRTVELEFLPPGPDARLDGVLRGSERVLSRSGSAARVRLEGGDPRQAELARDLVHRGVGLLGIRRIRPGLADRYLEVVGREDPP